eukprot:8808062-Pyramimonas_sp.AAC.1
MRRVACNPILQAAKYNYALQTRRRLICETSRNAPARRQRSRTTSHSARGASRMQQRRRID